MFVSIYRYFSLKLRIIITLQSMQKKKKIDCENLCINMPFVNCENTSTNIIVNSKMKINKISNI